MNKPKPDILLVITDSAKNAVAMFSMPEVTGFDLRGNGALAIMSGNVIARAYAAGHWEAAFLDNKESMLARAQEAQHQQAQAVAEQMNREAKAAAAKTAPAGDNVAEFPTP